MNNESGENFILETVKREMQKRLCASRQMITTSCATSLSFSFFVIHSFTFLLLLIKWPFLVRMSSLNAALFFINFVFFHHVASLSLSNFSRRNMITSLDNKCCLYTHTHTHTRTRCINIYYYYYYIYTLCVHNRLIYEECGRFAEIEKEVAPLLVVVVDRANQRDWVRKRGSRKWDCGVKKKREENRA